MTAAAGLASGPDPLFRRPDPGIDERQHHPAKPARRCRGRPDPKPPLRGAHPPPRRGPDLRCLAVDQISADPRRALPLHPPARGAARGGDARPRPAEPSAGAGQRNAAAVVACNFGRQGCTRRRGAAATGGVAWGVGAALQIRTWPASSRPTELCGRRSAGGRRARTRRRRATHAVVRGGGGHAQRRILTSPAADADANAKTAIADKPELFLDLVRILRDVTSPVAIRCMAAAVQIRGRLARASMVRAGPSPHWRWAWIDQSIDEPSRAAADLVVLLGFHHVLLATCRCSPFAWPSVGALHLLS
ncbi:translation initiation factor IF-2-like [Panicum virgatum]|uniref:translation initiation factor IF-2-like n=1 Tax=Panicum virgatum TaxID=38727 RepID=UPI0019D597E7|nr:translation initiation factor IF-2-like [Panicum virgatum]